MYNQNLKGCNTSFSEFTSEMQLHIPNYKIYIYIHTYIEKEYRFLQLK